MYVRMYKCVCVRACVRACVRPCVCVCMCGCVCKLTSYITFTTWHLMNSILRTLSIDIVRCLACRIPHTHRAAYLGRCCKSRSHHCRLGQWSASARLEHHGNFSRQHNVLANPKNVLHHYYHIFQSNTMKKSWLNRLSRWKYHPSLFVLSLIVIQHWSENIRCMKDIRVSGCYF